MKKLALAVINALGIYLLSTHANSASFDCNKANTWVEKTICANTELSKLDEAMAKKYRNDLNSAANDEDSNANKNNMIIDQKLWLNFQRDTCKDTKCLIREYTEHVEKKPNYGMAWNFPDELSTSDLPSKNSFGEFSQEIEVPMYNSETNDWKVTGKTTNSISIHRVINKPYLSIIEGVIIFTNAHTCQITDSMATWSENHWIINNDAQNETRELRLYPAFYKGKPQLLLKDPDHRYRELHCGMRGYFDGIVLERE